MSIQITLTENDILNNPNDSALGEMIRKKYWDEKKQNEVNLDSFDHCVICGKETPYLRSTHIDYRTGYVEGGGQGCFQPNICDKN